MTINIQPYTSLRAPASVEELVILKSESQLAALNLDTFVVLGEGTNVLFTEDFSGTVLINRLKGITVSDDNSQVDVTAKAGENWHEFVCHMAELGFHGLENLALIPGTVGASPVQNIGAYGVEVASCIKHVQVYDLANHETKIIDNAACEFGYRESVFKRNAMRKRYIITAVTFTLSKTFNPVLTYKDLDAFFNNKASISAKSLIDLVVRIRQSKLYDYRIVPNAGSFFRNPILSSEEGKAFLATNTDAPYFQLSDNKIKIPAAWLIEKAGLKGFDYNGAGVSDKHALILTNPGLSTGKNVASLAKLITKKVKEKFNVILEPEVRFINRHG